MRFYNSVKHKFLGIRMMVPIPLFINSKNKKVKVISLNNKKVRPLFDLIKCDNEYESNLLLNARVNYKEKSLMGIRRDIDKGKGAGRGARYFNGILCTIFSLPSLNLMRKHAVRDYQIKVLQIHSYEGLSPRSKKNYLKQKRKKYIKYKVAKKKRR